ncbi:MAG: hypothetical protein ACYC6V_02940 [Bacillota bacterium]
MAVFKDASEVYLCIGGLFRRAMSDPLSQKVSDSKIAVRFNYSDPDSAITVDAKNPPPGQPYAIYEGDIDFKPDVVMSMKADVAHQFWLGKVNLVAALAKGQMKAVGPIQSIIKLIPVIKPAFELYPQYLKEIGRADLTQ